MRGHHPDAQLQVDVTVGAGPHGRRGAAATPVDRAGVLVPRDHRRPPVGARRLRLDDRDVDPIAFAPERCRGERRRRRRRGVDAGVVLDDAPPQLDRVAVGEPSEIEGPAQGVVHDLRAPEVLVRPRLPEVRYRDHHQHRVDFGKDVVGEPQRRHHVGMEVLDEDVGLGGEALDDLGAPRVLEVEGDAALPGVQVQEEAALLDMWLAVGEGAGAARPVAPVAALDLDHVGAVLREQARGVRPRDVVGEVEDGDAFKGCLDHGALPAAGSDAPSYRPARGSASAAYRPPFPRSSGNPRPCATGP